MKIADFNGKNVCVLGYGREGKAVVKALEIYAPECDITIADSNDEVQSMNEELQKTKHDLQIGSGWLHNLQKFDVLIKSPGISLSTLKPNTYNLLTNSTQIFLDTIANRGATVIGVTGSKGKSTTSSLIHTILTTARKDARLYGNIGEPAIAHLGDVKNGTIVVLEMSSYQLHDLTVSPHIAVVTSFFPEHLDWHGSLEAYREAKMNIARHQQEDDLVFFNERTAAVIAAEGNGRKIPFSDDDCPIDIADTKLIGDHNRSNIAAACMVAASLGVDEKTALAAVRSFHPLPHRLQSLGIHNGIEWIDDSISTTPESTVAALDALGDRVTAIILGGQDRGYDFTSLAKRIAASPVQHVILLGESGPRIRETFEFAKGAISIHNVPSMEKAVSLAKLETRNSKLAKPIVLLSPASPSYDMFKNFEERGELFRKAIESADIA